MNIYQITKQLMCLPSMLLITLSFQGCGGDTPLSQLKEAWSSNNRPEIISGDDMEFGLQNLPLEGQAQTIGWSDDYWPSFRGGISYRWQDRSYLYTVPSSGELASLNVARLSPAEKYDYYMGRFDFPTVQAERARTQVMRTNRNSPIYDPEFEIPSWYGLCHGWAPASVNFQEPQPITVQAINGVEVPFGSSDIKALLTYYQQYKGNRSVKNYFMSERCNESFKELDEMLKNQEITEEEYHNRRNQGSCKGVNAGAFHLVLTNELGIKQEPIIADVTRDAEVMNYPIHSYQTEVLEETEGASDTAAAGTVREVKVRTSIEHSLSTLAKWEAFEPATKKRIYEYVLEIDADGKIIGGEWVTDERPDFLWRQTVPEFRGYFKALETIYQLATQDNTVIAGN
ncbi:MAG: hypothetical protein ACOH5I_25720 [Oligoflexus sp.]